ncbi:MAG: nuclear transport factor 2 family protein [Oscillospiraceae bacterium]|nr:nuclear transport factor 2 family protein [Oscillospiraceae bacterium]
MINASDFKELSNVTVTGVDTASLSAEQTAVLYAQARYCQAMTEADTDTMRGLVSEDKIYVHMSGKRQTRDEYFEDILNGSLRYYSIGIADPVIRVDGDRGSITYTSVLNASAYGARGTFRIKGTHRYELRDGRWTEVN